MPLLPEEPFVHPDDLLSNPTDPAGAESWWVLHTRPRAEKALVRRVLAHGLQFFLPLYQRRWRNRGRLLSSHLPLFPGYVFLRGDDDARVKSLTTNLVARCIPVLDQARMQADLFRVHRLMTADAMLCPEERLQPGMRVEITTGSLAGLEGTILRRGNRLHFLVEVHLLQQGVSVEIESWMFRPLDRAPLVAAGR